MAYLFLVWIIACVFIFLLGVTIGHSLFTLKLRREENKKRELELELLSKRNQTLNESAFISEKLEELIYRVNVKKEIDNIIGTRDAP